MIEGILIGLTTALTLQNILDLKAVKEGNNRISQIFQNLSRFSTTLYPTTPRTQISTMTPSVSRSRPKIPPKLYITEKNQPTITLEIPFYDTASSFLNLNEDNPQMLSPTAKLSLELRLNSSRQLTSFRASFPPILRKRSAARRNLSLQPPVSA